MDKKTILSKIIEAKGKCPHLLQTNSLDVESLPCIICPLHRLEKKPDGSYAGCFGSLIKKPEDVKDMNNRYVKAATDALADILIEEMLDEHREETSTSNKDRGVQ